MSKFKCSLCNLWDEGDSRFMVPWATRKRTTSGIDVRVCYPCYLRFNRAKGKNKFTGRRLAKLYHSIEKLFGPEFFIDLNKKEYERENL